MVGSDFVRTGLETCGVPARKIRAVPYGVDVARFGTTEPRTRTDGAPLRALFAEEAGLRTGVPDLPHALAELGSNAVQARFPGTVALAPEHLARFSGVATFLAPVPRPQMPALFQWADVFVLPSIVEGSATVTYEALLSGVPVITTPNAGSIVEDGVNRFVVPIRDHRALADAIGRYTQDRDLLARHRAACVEGRERAGLERYKAGLVAAIHSTVNGYSQKRPESASEIFVCD